MIVGIGIDLVEIERMTHILSRKEGSRFLDRILTPKERERATGALRRQAEYAAGRFAAKEAVSKALGCGIGKYVGLQDIEVLPDEQGKPHCTLSDQSRQRLQLGEDIRIHISITHSEATAAAYAIVERV